ncbi:MAG: xanthine dehydrogenase small subunit [Burkholderiales bacterium RIFCSPLOWO2_12_FULL_61_40]|nr:MAG: xanthine dehydrogenase small subunit [Burkholderiales bacterium RIFCSPLOWO2_12_FULL_61_40]
MHTKPLRFIRRGEVVTLHGVEPSRTLLEVLREDLHCTGTKEGCGEGDCGACSVVVAEPNGDQLKYSTVNSCIRLAHSIDGMALWTVEDIADTEGQLHPAQEALAQCHGSQCGFCTPGFAMSLFGLYQNHTAQGTSISRSQAQHALSGNLCRCTGYRPILDAAQAMQALPPVRVDEALLLSKMELLAHIPQGLEADSSYISPKNLLTLLQARAQYPEAQLVAGCTDVGLWITKMHMQFPRVLDTTQVQELRQVEQHPQHIAIGAAVTLTDAFAALVADRPQLLSFAQRFAGLPVRNSGTLGGNVANGSPIGDSMPLLIALGAQVVLMAYRDGQLASREMPLEALYTGYRKNVMAKDEVLAWIKVPKATATERARVYKISKRFEDDISAVCLGIKLEIADGQVVQASIGAGGVAATPVRARQTEASLVGQPWTQATVTAAMQTLRAECSPISDMRASAAYRVQVLGNLLQRYWLESQGVAQLDVQNLTLEGACA